MCRLSSFLIEKEEKFLIPEIGSFRKLPKIVDKGFFVRFALFHVLNEFMKYIWMNWWHPFENYWIILERHMVVAESPIRGFFYRTPRNFFFLSFIYKNMPSSKNYSIKTIALKKCYIIILIFRTHAKFEFAQFISESYLN